MSKPQTILDLSECIKLARELDILGDYEKALSKYQTALNLVTQRKSEVSDSSLKENWSQVETLINNEIKMTQDALKFARTFQNSDETRLERAKQEEICNQNLKRINQEQNEIQYDPRWKRFGGMRPFEVWEKDEPEDPKERDPDVWSPPKVKPNQNQNRGFNRERAKAYDPKKAAGYGNVGKAPPGKGQNQKGKDTGKNNVKDENDPRKGKSIIKFLFSNFSLFKNIENDNIIEILSEIKKRRNNASSKNIQKILYEKKKVDQKKSDETHLEKEELPKFNNILLDDDIKENINIKK